MKLTNNKFAPWIYMRNIEQLLLPIVPHQLDKLLDTFCALGDDCEIFFSVEHTKLTYVGHAHTQKERKEHMRSGYVSTYLSNLRSEPKDSWYILLNVSLVPNEGHTGFLTVGKMLEVHDPCSFICVDSLKEFAQVYFDPRYLYQIHWEKFKTYVEEVLAYDFPAAHRLVSKMIYEQ